jgi:hypothetical protein
VSSSWRNADALQVETHGRLVQQALHVNRSSKSRWIRDRHSKSRGTKTRGRHLVRKPGCWCPKAQSTDAPPWATVHASRGPPRRCRRDSFYPRYCLTAPLGLSGAAAESRPAESGTMLRPPWPRLRQMSRLARWLRKTSVEADLDSRSTRRKVLRHEQHHLHHWSRGRRRSDPVVAWAALTTTPLQRLVGSRTGARRDASKRVPPWRAVLAADTPEPACPSWTNQKAGSEERRSHRLEASAWMFGNSRTAPPR